MIHLSNSIHQVSDDDSDTVLQFLHQDAEFNSLVQDWLEDTSSPSSPSSASSVAQPILSREPEENYRKKKRARVTRRASTNAAYIPSLRILRRDVRRNYGDMFNNIFNNYDPKLVSEFCRTFMSPDFRYADTVSQEIQDKSVFRSVYVQGAKAFTNLIAALDYIMPDQVIQLQSVQVCKRSNEVGSRIVSKVSMEGHLLHHPQVSIDSMEVDDEGNVNRSQFQFQSFPEGNVNRSQFQFQSFPERIHFEGICIIYLDENHRMRIMEMIIDKSY